jgi:hypothetical protein
MPDRTPEPPDPAQGADYHLPKCLYRVELDDPYEVRYWTRLYKITEEELGALVAQLGSDRNRIEDYLSL